VRVVFDRLLEIPGVVEVVTLRSRVGFLAVHGGLEGGTAEMAAAAAASAGASLYAVTQPHSLGWHVPSHRIRIAAAPRLAAFLAHVEVVVSIHGYFRPELPEVLYVGGGNRTLAAALADRLRRAVPEFGVVDDLRAIPTSMRGVHPGNPVNRAPGGGVQLELPHPARSRRRGSAIPDGDEPIDRLVDALGAFAAGLAA
jgi:phage replication-related protein YjqB (UPF0714/DUF867 family)